VPSEHAEQAFVVAWARAHEHIEPRLAMLLSIPNGANKSPAARAKFQREGLRAGVPDLFLAAPELVAWEEPAHGLFVEMKRVRGGVVSPEQRAWHEALRGQGYRVVVAKGAEEGITAIQDYLGMER